MPTDKELVEIARGCATRFCQPWPLARQHAEDVQQAIWIALRACRSRFDPSRGVPFRAFAARAIRGAAIDALAAATGVPRARYRLGHRPARGFAEGESFRDARAADPSHAAESAERSATLERAIDALPQPLAAIAKAICSGEPERSVARRLRLTLRQFGRVMTAMQDRIREQFRGTLTERNPMTVPAQGATKPTSSAVTSQMLANVDGASLRAIFDALVAAVAAEPSREKIGACADFVRLGRTIDEVRDAAARLAIGVGEQLQLEFAPAQLDRPPARR